MAWAYGERRRDTELTLHDLASRLIDRVLGAVAQRLDQCVVAVGCKLGADAQQRRDQRGLEHAAPMIVHAIPNPRHTGRIGTWLAVQQDRAAAWKNKPIPGEQHAALARRDRSEEHTSELQSLMRISYAVFCLNKKKTKNKTEYIPD